MTIQLFHNVRCTKSRATLELLEQRDVAFETIFYLEAPLTEALIRQLLSALNFDDARQLMRTNEDLYKNLGLANITDHSLLIEAMVNHPILIERPIVYNSETNKAAIGRPPENVLHIL